MPKQPPKILTPWENWIGDYRATDARLRTPASAQEMIDLVSEAVASGKRIRAAGASHSTTSVARPDHFWVQLDEAQAVLPLEHVKGSRESDARNYVRIDAGARLKTVNRVLLGDKAVYNMGSFDWQSLIGAISTGTHGSGIRLGPIADSVVSIDMVTVRSVDGAPDVRMRRIEPKDGLTDPWSFAAAEPDMELIQDDDVFFSVVVSFGCIGLVHSLVLDVRDAYWLNEINEAMRWADVKELLTCDAGTLPKVLTSNRHWEFVVNGAETRGDDATTNPMCLVLRRNVIETPAKPKDWDDRLAWPPLRTEEGSLQWLVETYVRPGIDNEDGKVLGLFDIGNLIADGFKNLAAEPPFEGGLNHSRNYWVLRRERDDTGPRDEPDPPPDAISCEIAVPVERTIEAVDRILRLMRDSKYFYATPFGVRFVAPSKHYLAPQYGRATTMIEVPLVLPNRAEKRADELPTFKKALADIEHLLCNADDGLDGRPHWGQYNTLHRARLERYPKLPVFERVYSDHNAFGTFDNDYTRQIGLVRSATPAQEVDHPERRIAIDHVLS